MPMSAEGYALRGGSDERVGAMNELTARVAREYGNVIFVSFPDYDPAIHIRADLMHPNEAGHRVIYEAFGRKVRRLYLPVVSH